MISEDSEMFPELHELELCDDVCTWSDGVEDRVWLDEGTRIIKVGDVEQHCLSKKRVREKIDEIHNRLWSRNLEDYDDGPLNALKKELGL